MTKLWIGLVRFGFRLLYSEFAWTYDLVSWVVSLGQWQDWQKTSLAFIPRTDHTRILELAHGTGNLHVQLLEAGATVVGLDISPYMGRITWRKLSKLGLPIRLARGSAFSLPFSDKSFDTVVSTFPTDFFFQEPVLLEVKRVLSDKGRFIVVPAAQLNPGGLVHTTLEWLFKVTGQRGNWTETIKVQFAEANLELRIETVDLPGSQVNVLIATKDVGNKV